MSASYHVGSASLAHTGYTIDCVFDRVRGGGVTPPLQPLPATAVRGGSDQGRRLTPHRHQPPPPAPITHQTVIISEPTAAAGRGIGVAGPAQVDADNNSTRH